jgi:hypothetical protein
MVRLLSLTLVLTALAACVPSTSAPVQVAAPLPRPQPIQTSAADQRPMPTQPSRPAPAPSDGWLNAPLSPGGWTYRSAREGGSAAFFGTRGAPIFTVSCEPGRRVSLRRMDASSGTSLAFRTSSASRSIAAMAAGGGQPGLVATVAADDPLLDALAFSRGRFALETSGARSLVIPAWPELARVVEDCRR